MRFSEKFKHCPTCGSDNFCIHSTKAMKCNSCGFVYYINPSAATAAFIFNQEGELLICTRAKEPAKGSWDLPGGFVDENETAEEAISRELHEELGIKPTSVKYIFSIPNEYEYSGLLIPTLDLFFECILPESHSIQASDDVESCFFINPSKINPDNFGLKSIKKAVVSYMTELKIK